MFEPFNFLIDSNEFEIISTLKTIADDCLILFRLQRTRGIKQSAAGLDAAHHRRQYRYLPVVLPLELFRAKPMANLGIARQCPRAAAWCVT